MQFVLLFAAAFASKAIISQNNIRMNEGEHLLLNYVEYMSNKNESANFHQHFPEEKVSFELTISGTNLEAENFYFVVAQTKDFLVACTIGKSVGDSVLLENGNVHIKGEKNMDFTGFAAAYLCHHGNKDPVSVHGEIVFKNVHGYIQTSHFGMIEFQAWLTFAYLCVLAVWVYILTQHPDSVEFYHHIITAIVISSVINEGFQFYVLNHENAYQMRSTTLLVLAKIVKAARCAMVRYVGLMLGFGWGMAQSVIEEQHMIIGLSAIYFLFELIIADDKSFRRNPVQGFFIILYCFADAFWGTVIITKLTDLHKELRENNQTHKAEFYAKSKKLMMYMVWVGISFSTLSVLFLNTTWRFKSFHKTWVFTSAAWKCMFFIVVTRAMSLYKPTKSSKLYAHAEQLPNRDDSSESFVKSASSNSALV